MRLEVYYPQDIRNALLAAEQASGAAWRAANGEDKEFAQGYREGYRDALATIALAFGLLHPDDRQERHDWRPVFLTAVSRNGGS
jgi:hypothetical protein